MKITTFLSVNNGNLGAIARMRMAPKFALFTKGSKLPLNKGFKNMFELLQSCPQPSNYAAQQQVRRFFHPKNADNFLIS